MGKTLALIVVGGMIVTGILLHFDYCFAALCAGLVVGVTIRWIWQNYA